MTHRIAPFCPVVDNRLRIDSAICPAHNVSKLPVIHCGVDAIDVLVLYVLDAGQNRLPSMANAAKFSSV